MSEIEPRWSRTTRDVLTSHLGYRARGDLEGDLAQNYAADVLLMSAEGINHGHDGIRKLASILDSCAPACRLLLR
jgi:hypothetical protein